MPLGCVDGTTSWVPSGLRRRAPWLPGAPVASSNGALCRRPALELTSRDQRRARSKRSRFITFVHAATKSRAKLACASPLAYTSASARTAASSSRHEVHDRARPLDLARAAVHALEHRIVLRRSLPLRAPVQAGSRRSRCSRSRAFREDTMLRWARVRAQTRAGRRRAPSSPAPTA